MALGPFFSAAEVIPLTFLTLEAWSFLQLGARQGARSPRPFPHFWAVMFLASVGFWNFLGAGVFGFLINLPIVSYYEIGTTPTANHGHAAMMGVYGMLAVALALFCLRYIIPEEHWSDRAAKISFWSLNLGPVWMVFATLLPLGIVQLLHSVSIGYFDARTLKFLTGRANPIIKWLRFPGDVVFIVGGAVPLVYLCWLGVRYGMGRPVEEEPAQVLFTEFIESKASRCAPSLSKYFSLRDTRFSSLRLLRYWNGLPGTRTAAPTSSRLWDLGTTRKWIVGNAPSGPTPIPYSYPRAACSPLSCPSPCL
jgi:nitric oxide reductase subunit B